MTNQWIIISNVKKFQSIYIAWSFILLDILITFLRMCGKTIELKIEKGQDGRPKVKFSTCWNTFQLMAMDSIQSIFREIVLNYANISPFSLQGLQEYRKSLQSNFEETFTPLLMENGKIDEELLIMDYLLECCFDINKGLRVETIVKFNEIGFAEAIKIIEDKPEQQLEFILDMIKAKKEDQWITIALDCIWNPVEICKKAFHDVYGWHSLIFPSCPCSSDRERVFAKKGFMTEHKIWRSLEEDEKIERYCLTEYSWNKGNGPGCLSCIECDHLYFINILERFANGESPDDLTQGYWKIPIRYGTPKTKELPRFCYIEHKSRFLEYLSGLPYKALISLLSEAPGEGRRIKKCPYCGHFFIAKNATRSFCYGKDCLKIDRNKRKQHQREVDPVKYP